MKLLEENKVFLLFLSNYQRALHTTQERLFVFYWNYSVGMGV